VTENQMVIYLANLVWIAAVDGDVKPDEAKTIASICHEIGATETVLHKALSVIAKGDYKLFPVGRFSDKIRNLEDMILVSLKDDPLVESEESGVLSFAGSIKITQNQLNEMISESKVRVFLQKTSIKCNLCDKEVPPPSKFCPYCGNKT